MTIFSEFWNFTILSNGEKKCDEHMGPIKKIAQQIRRGKKQFWGLLYPIIQKIKKIPYGPHVGVYLYGRRTRNNSLYWDNWTWNWIFPESILFLKQEGAMQHFHLLDQRYTEETTQVAMIARNANRRLHLIKLKPYDYCLQSMVEICITIIINCGISSSWLRILFNARQGEWD